MRGLVWLFRWLYRLLKSLFQRHRMYRRSTIRISGARPMPLFSHMRQWLSRIRPLQDALPIFGQRKPAITDKPIRRGKRKPPWVKRKILRLRALMPDESCRTIANIFNRQYIAQEMSVGKTYVSNVIRQHQYDTQVIRRTIKQQRPKPLPRNVVWGLDLTGKQDANRKTHSILGLLDHGSRAVITLLALREKSTIAILRRLLDAIEQFGKPRQLRTDNEAVFTSFLFRLSLWWLGIQHRRIDPHCPWQNGRIERLFATLKAKLDRWEVTCLEELNGALGQFRLWYNHVRPHQHLDGRTPAEVWTGVDVYAVQPKQEYWFEAWDGLLQGIYLKH